MADHQNWASLLQKLAPQNLGQEIKPAVDANLASMFSHENILKNSIVNENALSNIEAANRASLYESTASAATVNYIEDVPDLQIKNVRNINPEERTGRTIALNSRFICYSDENDTLFIQSLKNLSLIHIIQELNSKISDISFLEDTLTNYLGLVTVNGTVVVYHIDLNQAKDKIIVKDILTQNLERFSEDIQLQWKNSKKIGVATEKEITAFDIDSQNANAEGNQNSFQFEETIIDFAFSPSYPLVYVLLETNVIQVINIDNGSKVREFTPHKDAIESVIRVLPYKSLIRHELVQGKGIVVEADKLHDEPMRDIFLTVTRGFEVKVWDLSEWDAENEAYHCIETYQLNQNNNNYDSNNLVKRCIFYDPGLNFVFLGFKLSDEKGINITALHIDEFYHGYSDSYAAVKKSKKFINSTQTLLIKKNSVTDLSVLTFGDDEIDTYFKKNAYIQMTDTEPASTRTQDGSYACDSKSVLIFFVHNEDSVSVGKVLGEKLYPFALAEEIDKMTQAEQLENQPNVPKGEGVNSFPPELSGFIKEIINESKKLQEEEKNVKSDADFGKGGQKGGNKKLEYSDEVSESYNKISQKESSIKEDTNSPDAPKAQSHKKKHGGNERKKDKEGGQGKGQKGDSQKGTNAPINAANLESALGIGQDSQAGKKDDGQFQTLEKGIEKRFQDLTDKSIQLLNNKFSRIEEVIEKRVNERVAKLQLETLNNNIAKQIDEKLSKEFSNAFERSVTPCFEKYLIKMFEQVSASFEKGQKFYIDKLNIEQAKGAQMKDTMNEVIKSFVQISNSLNDGLMNNQGSFNRIDLNIQDKQNQITRLIDQVNDIMIKQEEIHDKIEGIKKNVHEMRLQHQAEVAAFGETANRFLQLQNPNDPKNQYPKKGESGSNPFPYAYLEYLTKRPMESSGGPMFRGGFPMGASGMGFPMTASQLYGPAYSRHMPYDYYAYSKPPQNPYAQNLPNPTPPQNINQLPNINQQNPQNIPNTNVNQTFDNQNQANKNNQPAQQMGQISPELQNLLFQLLGQQQQASKDKEEDKYLPSIISEEDPKKFSTQSGQGKPPASQQTPSSQRGSSHLENPPFTKTPSSSTPNQTFIQQDQDTLDKPNLQLPPGMQTQNQAQPNFVQALLDNLPPNLQQNFTQGQGINQQKSPDAFAHGFNLQNNAQNTGNQAGQGGINLNYLQNLFPGHVNTNQNYTNFGGYQGFPPQMANATIKPNAIKNPSSVDFNQIPLVNSMFKTPSRDTTTDEETNPNSK